MMQVTKVWWDGERLMAEPIDPTTIYQEPAQQERMAWVGLDLDGMVEAFHRVIEEHHSKTNPFNDPVNKDAMIALRELRGLIAYMKRNTSPPAQRTWVSLTDEEIAQGNKESWVTEQAWQSAVWWAEAKLKQRNT